MILGFLFERLYDRLPGAGAIAKGGVFALALGLGLQPAALMFAMLMSYAIVMSLLYAWLTVPARQTSQA